MVLLTYMCHNKSTKNVVKKKHTWNGSSGLYNVLTLSLIFVFWGLAKNSYQRIIGCATLVEFPVPAGRPWIACATWMSRTGSERINGERINGLVITYL